MSVTKKPRLLVTQETGQQVIDGVFVPRPQDNTENPARQVKISDYLNTGAVHAVPRRELEAMTGLDGRTIRLLIQRERLDGTPICSECIAGSGYFLPADSTERASCVASLRHRAREIMQTAAAIERAVL